MDIDERLTELMKTQHATQQSFAEYLGISPATLSSIIKKRTKVTLSTVLAIKKKFPTLNYSWLLDGTGPMFLDDESGASSQSSNPSSSSASEPFIDFEGNLVNPDETVEATSLSPSNSESPVAADVVPSDSRQLEQAQGHSSNNGSSSKRNPNIVVPKNINIIRRNVSQILVIYDDQTCETFVPKK